MRASASGPPAGVWNSCTTSPASPGRSASAAVRSCGSTRQSRVTAWRSAVHRIQRASARPPACGASRAGRKGLTQRMFIVRIARGTYYNRRIPMKVVLLAGGLGTRLREETEFRPKPMVTIGGRPILWHIMKLFAFYSVTDFVVPIGYRGDVIRDYFINYEARTNDFTIRLGHTHEIE